MPHPGGKEKWLQTPWAPMQVVQGDRTQQGRHRFYFSLCSGCLHFIPVWGSPKVKRALKPSLKFQNEPSAALTGYHIAGKPKNAIQLNAKPQLLLPKSFPFASFIPLGVTLPEFNIFERRKKNSLNFFSFFLDIKHFQSSWTCRRVSEVKHSTSMSLWELQLLFI